MDEKARIKRKEQMLKLRDKGYTLEQLAKKYGISRQRVHYIVGKTDERWFTYVTPERVTYPNLRAWMNDNKVSVAELCRRVYGALHPSQQHRLGRCLKGNADNLRFCEIKNLVEVTGLTFEELFYEE